MESKKYQENLAEFGGELYRIEEFVYPDINIFLSAMIREYTENDLESLKTFICELQNFLFRLEPDIVSSGNVADSYTEFVLKKVHDQRGKIYLAELDGKSVGFIALAVEKEPDEEVEYLYVTDLLVSVSFRDKGLGKQLLDQAEKYARELNLKYVRIGSLVSNERASRVYKNFGFEDYLTILQKKL